MDKFYHCFDMNSLTGTVAVLLCSYTGQQQKTYLVWSVGEAQILYCIYLQHLINYY